MHLGIDIGSVSLKAVLLDDQKRVVEKHYVRTHGQPMETALAVLRDMTSRVPVDETGAKPGAIHGLACTGTGGKLLAKVMGLEFVNELVAQSRATGVLHPHVRTIIEIGGEDSKLILIEHNPKTNRTRLRDFAMNAICAAGTGSFLDQQAARLGIAIENEFGELALKSKKPPRIAGRCSVFAKSDMIHLQQEGTPVHDIIAGLCYALVRNYRSNIAKGKELEKPISFQGGVAANKGIVRAFEDVLELQPGELLIPEHYAWMGAIGAVLALLDAGHRSPLKGLKPLEEYLHARHVVAERHRPLVADNYPIVYETQPVAAKIDAYVGVDVGSISTNVVVIDKENRVLARRYLMTAGRPLEAVTRGLYEVGQEVGDKVIVRAVGTTGSGRYLTADFIGADVAKNEITTHATAAAEVNPHVDTIFEIGGQDSKYVSLENGAIVDFNMNKVCAAGTGSFLEEQAEKLGISIIEQFGQLALGAQSPVQLGERCTVFMESDLNRHQQQGVEKDNLVGGLSYSIVYNYLNKVVEDRKIGDVIFFQGGVAANRAVKAAFEAVVGRKIIVPPHHDMMGAIGSAMIARAETTGPSQFKGFDLRHRKYELTVVECKDCANQCELRRVDVQGEQPLYYGSRCGKYDEEKRGAKKGTDLPRLFRERRAALFHSYPKDKPDRPTGERVGIPQIGTFFELFPMYKAFFTELGFEVVTSRDTNRTVIHSGTEHSTAEACFPIKVAYGHVLDVLEKRVDYLFMPSVINMPHACSEFVHSYTCPYVQSLPYLIRAAIDVEAHGAKVLAPIIHLEWGERDVDRAFVKLARRLGASRQRAIEALRVAREAQRQFYAALDRRGREALEGLSDSSQAMVIISRPYNGCDSGLNLNLPDKLRDLGVLAIPMDFLPLRLDEVANDYPHMYWKYGQKILAAAKLIAQNPRLHALYITNFGCGPDSFISKFFQKELGGKPYLTIEIDEHSADVGAITRCEAFLDSVRNARKVGRRERPVVKDRPLRPIVRGRKRTVYVPYMDDHGSLLAAAMRANGMDAEALPLSDEKSLELGRKHTSGRECYPCIITTGDILKKVFEQGFNPSASAFFMPSAFGPCRFGQYNQFHRMLLDDLGFHDVPMVVLDQTKGYDESVRNLGPRFRKLAWNGIVFTDLLQKLARQTRPYEVNKGETDRVYEELLRRAAQVVQANGDLRRLAFDAREAFDSIPVDRSAPKPRIGVVGEIFVRCNQFTNNFVVRRIEKLGGEVASATVQEWLDYTGHCRRKDHLRERNFRGYVKEVLTG
ncbi:MAG: CoA activase, partial [Planctomycetes bacterium]|nr:CoA activase [Planctomycetota bacterium]